MIYCEDCKYLRYIVAGGNIIASGWKCTSPENKKFIPYDKKWLEKRPDYETTETPWVLNKDNNCKLYEEKHE